MFGWANTRRVRLSVAISVLVSVLLAGVLAFAKEAATTTTTFAGVSLKVSNETIPPSGMLQYKLFLTEPKPMSTGSAQPTLWTAPTGISINDPSGQACAAAVWNNGLTINFLSPNSLLGTNVDYPILTMAVPVPANAPVGQQSPLSMNVPNSLFLDSSGQPYPVEFVPGTLTIGGSVNISNVIPGSGVVPAGATIALMGSGFTANTKVQLPDATVMSTNLVSSNELDITLDTTLQLSGERIKVTNTDTGDTDTYYSYLRAAWLGSSSNWLLARTYPVFSQVTYSSATLPWVHNSTTFTGMALQNPTSNWAQVSVQLLSSTNQVLQSFSFSLSPKTKVERDIQEVFPFGFGGAAVRVSSNVPLQMLGLQGNTSTVTVIPVIVSGQ
jgi:hypothetical protein